MSPLWLTVLSVAGNACDASALAPAAPSSAAISRLTWASESHGRPVYSPDGRFVAAVEIGPHGQTCFIIDRIGNRIAAAGGVGDTVVGTPSWAADGQRVCWLTARPSLWILSTDGAATCTDLRINGVPRQVLWQPSGGRVLVGTASGIYSLPLDSREPPHRVPSWEDGGELGAVSLSRDGRRLAYIAGDTVFVAAGPGSRGRIVAPPQDDGLVYSCVWLSPDGAMAVLLRTPSPEQAGRDATQDQLVQWPWHVRTPSGFRLYDGEQRVLLADLLRLEQGPLDVPEGRVACVDWSATGPFRGGHRLAVRAGNAVVLYGPLGQRERVLLEDPLAEGALSYDPRGSNIIFASARDPMESAGAKTPHPNLFAVAL